MKKVRVLLSVLLCLILAMGMAACGGPTTPDGDDPENPSGDGEINNPDRYKVTGAEWESSIATLYEGFTATITAMDLDETVEDADYYWNVVTRDPERYEDFTATGTARDEAMITLRFDGNRLLCDWNDASVTKWANSGTVFDSAWERVWNSDTLQYDYYCYLKDDGGEWESHSLECGTADNSLDVNNDRYNFSSYSNPNLSKGNVGFAVADPNAWWAGEMTSPFASILTKVAETLEESTLEHPSAKFDETTNSYKAGKGAVSRCGVLYADEEQRVIYLDNNTTTLLVDNVEVKFDNGKCLSVSYDAYSLDDNKLAYRVEVVRNTDFVDLPDGGHGRGLAYAERAEAMENAASVINGAVQPTNFTKTVSVKPDTKKQLTVGEEHTFKVADNAIYIKSRVYTGDIEANTEYTPSLWVETEYYNGRESDAIYYYSQQNGSWQKQAEPAPDGVNALWTEMREGWYKYVRGEEGEEAPIAPSDLFYDAENDVYWSADGHCIRVGDNAMWSYQSRYTEQYISVFVTWKITDMGSTEVTLPTVA